MVKHKLNDVNEAEGYVEGGGDTRAVLYVGLDGEDDKSKYSMVTSPSFQPGAAAV